MRLEDAKTTYRAEVVGPLVVGGVGALDGRSVGDLEGGMAALPMQRCPIDAEHGPVDAYAQFVVSLHEPRIDVYVSALDVQFWQVRLSYGARSVPEANPVHT
jgi:hypothetical protein